MRVETNSRSFSSPLPFCSAAFARCRTSRGLLLRSGTSSVAVQHPCKAGCGAGRFAALRGNWTPRAVGRGKLWGSRLSAAARDAPARARWSDSFTPVRLTPGVGNKAHAKRNLPPPQPLHGRQSGPCSPARPGPSPPAGAAEGGGFGVQPRTRPFLFCLWQQGNKNTLVLLQSDDEWWMRSEVGMQRFAVLLLKHIQILLCLQHPILKLCTCSCREPSSPAIGTNGSR